MTPDLQIWIKVNWKCFRILQNREQAKNASDMLPFLMDAASRGKGNGLNFSSNEISAVLEVLKMGKSPQEAAKIDRIVSLMRMIR